MQQSNVVVGPSSVHVVDANAGSFLEKWFDKIDNNNGYETENSDNGEEEFVELKSHVPPEKLL